jgi:hypothetical protein
MVSCGDTPRGVLLHGLGLNGKMEQLSDVLLQGWLYDGIQRG